MCERLVQEYRIWLEELLEALHEICEDVVPAGRVNEETYWQTKALCGERKCKSSEEFSAALLQYAADGREVLAHVKASLASEEERTEETIIRLRRMNATAILNSLQMLANYAYLAGQYADIYEEFSKYFEVDTIEDVKRIRSGVIVEQVLQNGEVASKIKAYNFRERKVKAWKGYVAG